MTEELSPYVGTDDIAPLTAAATEPDLRLRGEALTALAALPLDGPATDRVGDLLLTHLRTERLLPDALIQAAGRLPHPAVRELLTDWAADDESDHQATADRALALAEAQPPPSPAPRTPTGPAPAGAVPSPADLLASPGLPADLPTLRTLPSEQAESLVGGIVRTLLLTASVASAEELAERTARLAAVLDALGGPVLIRRPDLTAALPEGRTTWAGALLTLVAPAQVLAAAGPRLESADSGIRLTALRQLARAARFLGRPPEQWPAPDAEPLGDLPALVQLLQGDAPRNVRWNDTDRGVADTGIAAGLEVTGAPPSPIDSSELSGPTRSAGSPAAAPPAARSAYARLDAPDRVAPAEAFELRVGLAEAPSAGVVQAVPYRVPATPFRLTVELLADGFDLLGGASFVVELPAGPDDPFPYQVLRLRAQTDAALAAERAIQAVYSVDGRWIGVAHRRILVSAAPAETPATPTAAEPAGAVWVLPDDPATHPDLEILVAPGNDTAGELLQWRIRSPHSTVPTPAEPVRTRLLNAGTFARSVMENVQDHLDAEDLPEVLKGIGLRIADAVPDEVWTALRAAAAVASPPTVLLATWDQEVPWELAVVSAPWTPELPAHLGAQAVVGRWTYRERARTPVPPARLRAGSMAVVSGVYEGAERLEQAEQEAGTLRQQYAAEGVDAGVGPVLACLKRPAAPEILHLAVHGQFDVNGYQDGIRMTDGNYLSPDSVRGVGCSGVRLVFLNACQLGQQQQMLGDSAGMVPSFLGLGAGAAVAPLWKVDDAVAQRLAEGFYREVLGNGVTPAEFLRRVRAETLGATGAALSTPLAYLYFGHPRLTVEWTRPAG